MRIIFDGSVSTVKRLRVSLGTLVAIEARAESVCLAEGAIEAAFAAITLVGRRMHPAAENSDLAKINSAAVGVPTRVHASIGKLLNFAGRIHELSGGIFDPCTPARRGRLTDIVVSADESEVVCHAPVAVDLGGFAKGYAVDCAVESLIAAGCSAGLVNAGGDLRVFGPRVETVFVRGPAGALMKMSVTDTALAASDLHATGPPEHQGYYGARPVAHFAAVLASRGVIADALTKCVLLCDRAVAAKALQAFTATTVSSD